MEAGKHRHRLRIEQRSSTRHADYGTPVDTWSTFATVWAELEDVLPSKGEGQPDSLRLAEAPARVRMRYMPGITSAMRVVDLSRSNRVLRILTTPAEMGNKARLEFMVAEYTTSGNAQ